VAQEQVMRRHNSGTVQAKTSFRSLGRSRHDFFECPAGEFLSDEPWQLVKPLLPPASTRGKAAGGAPHQTAGLRLF
jgi:hypothetical protein